MRNNFGLNAENLYVLNNENEGPRMKRLWLVRGRADVLQKENEPHYDSKDKNAEK